MGRGDLKGPMPAQFALRVAVLGGVGLAMFAIVFFRLWYLQVLSGDHYKAEAQNNQVREFTVQAPRGQITDRHGQVLVDNRTALELQVKQTDLPASKARRAKEFRHLQQVAGLRPEQIRHRIRAEAKECAACAATLRRDVPYDTVYYLRENQDRFPGVSVQRVFVRQYPQGTVAAHVLGYVGEVTNDDLKDPRYQSLEPGDKVGKGGVEYTYDSLLRGVNGATRVQVDASGQPTGGQLSTRDPRSGNNLVLTLDDDVQRAGQDAISAQGLPGGFVAMNVRNGELLGLGSSPSYDPAVFAEAAGPAVGLQGAHLGGERSAPVRPCDQRPLSDRLDLQADHLARRRSTRGRSGSGRSSTTPGRSRSATARCSTTPAVPSTGRSASSRRSRSPPTSSSTTSGST